jgi:hypothetical protein
MSGCRDIFLRRDWWRAEGLFLGVNLLPPTVLPAKAGISGEGTQQWSMTRGGNTYIMTNRARGVLYVGVTADLAHASNNIGTVQVRPCKNMA